MSEANAFGAVTILNATATGRGCSLALRDGMRARWAWLDEPGIIWRQRDVDDAVARGALEVMRGAFDVPAGADAGTSTSWAPARGLKTSSAAASALIGAALEDAGQPRNPATIMALGVQANLVAGTSITGAFDDQVAVTCGGCHLTDNRDRNILLKVPVEPWHVAVWVPEASISKKLVKTIDATPIQQQVASAEASLRAGDVPAAMTTNGRAFHALYQAAGLPVSDAPVKAALAAGALGSGLSGTGPAVAALFDQPTELPAVAGGVWHWSQVQEETIC